MAAKKKPAKPGGAKSGTGKSGKAKSRSGGKKGSWPTHVRLLLIVLIGLLALVMVLAVLPLLREGARPRVAAPPVKPVEQSER